MYYIQCVLTICLELCCCNLFFETFSVKRNENRAIVHIGLMSLAILGSFLLSIVLNRLFLFRQLLFVFGIAGIMTLYYKLKYLKALVLAIMFQGIYLVTDFFVYLLILSNYGSKENMSESHFLQGMLLIIFGRILLFVFIFAIRLIMGKYKEISLLHKEWLKFIAFPLFTMFIVAAMIPVSERIHDNELESIFWFIAFGMAGMNIVVFYLINDVMKREKQNSDTKIYLISVENRLKMYQCISDNLEKNRKKAHEFKNQMTCIESLLADKQYLRLEKYLKEINGSIVKEFDYINTNNTIINAVVNTHFKQAMDKKITVLWKINDLCQLSITDEDIVVLISNLLNNAIEACEKCSEKKMIKIKIVKDDNSFIFSVRNTYSVEVCYKDGFIVTTKPNKMFEHGFGIKNVLDIVKKYSGSYSIQHENGEFFFSIVIPQ